MKKNPPNTIAINNNIKLTLSFSEWLLEIILIILYLFFVILCPLLYIKTPKGADNGSFSCQPSAVFLGRLLLYFYLSKHIL